MIRSGFHIVISLFISLMIVFVILSIPDTFARFLRSSTSSDAAKVAEFDIELKTPMVLEGISQGNPFDVQFSEKGQNTSFEFAITNNRQVVVQCIPFFDENVNYQIIVEGEAVERFVVGVGEEISFTIVIYSDGLKAFTLATNLIVQIEQL